MFIIATGRAEVQIAKEPGQFIPVAKLGPGELIGELALIDAQPRSAQVTALSKLDALQIMRVDFQKLQEKFHPATYKVTRRIALTVCAAYAPRIKILSTPSILTMRNHLIIFLPREVSLFGKDS